MTALRSAAPADAGVVRQLIRAALSSGAFKRQSTDAGPAADVSALSAESQAVVVPGSVQSFEWHWDGRSPDPRPRRRLIDAS